MIYNIIIELWNVSLELSRIEGYKKMRERRRIKATRDFMEKYGGASSLYVEMYYFIKVKTCSKLSLVSIVIDCLVDFFISFVNFFVILKVIIGFLNHFPIWMMVNTFVF